MFGWFRRRRRKKILATPFPETWNEIIRTNVLHDRHLTEQQRQRLRQYVQIFVAEKNWEGCRGLQMTDEIKVTIAGLAGLMVLEVGTDINFDHVLSILVYPDSYVAKDVEITRAGIVLERGQARLGEAWWRGPVILSWRDVLAGGRREAAGQNLVFHEFAHQLDMLNGRDVDGIPPLQTRQQLQRWLEVMAPEYQRHARDCRQGRRGVIDCYGATSDAEFFAVVTEAFFENPRQLALHHSQIYELLRDYFGLDPAAWSDSEHVKDQNASKNL
ncbi:MAG: zinc-dependent peptidase [Fuerstiella sp.]